MKAKLVILIAALLLILCACGKVNIPEETAATPAVEETAAPSAVSVVQDTLPLEPDVQDIPAKEDPVEEVSPVEEDVPIAFSPDFSFTTTDRDGNPYDETVFSGYRLTIINFWEPWCGPCVHEMPELQKLYENYSDKGLNIIGVYSTSGMEDDVNSVLRSSGITFTILHYTDAFDQFQTGYVPTTILVDGSGHVVSEEPIIGSNSYEGWEAVIKEYLS